MHEGHRMRMIEKLSKGVNLLEEHEQLEILLYNAQPRINTNPVAHRLLEKFGGVKQVLQASIEDLCMVEGVGTQVAAYLHLIGAFCRSYFPKSEITLPSEYTRVTFNEYICEHLKGLDYEVLEVYLIDTDNALSLCGRFTQREHTSVHLVPAEIIKMVAENASSSILIVHNHPDKTDGPSQADEEFTKQLQVLCSINNIYFLDHLIYLGEKNALYSFYDDGKMKDISREYNIRTLLHKE